MGTTSRTFKIPLQLVAGLFVMIITSTATASQKILVWGDSLSAAYGISVERGWVNLMRKELNGKASIINGSISGETTRGGLTRLPAALNTHRPDLVLIELGANDGLRGFPPKIIKANLKRMINKSRQSGARVVLLGMKIPPNYGVAYSKRFEAVFSELAKEYQLPFIPFFLENVIKNLQLLQQDELHPTAEAQPLLLRKVLPTIKRELNEKV